MSQKPRGENVPEGGQGQPHQEDRIWPERCSLDLERRNGNLVKAQSVDWWRWKPDLAGGIDE